MFLTIYHLSKMVGGRVVQRAKPRRKVLLKKTSSSS